MNRADLIALSNDQCLDCDICRFVIINRQWITMMSCKVNKYFALFLCDAANKYGSHRMNSCHCLREFVRTDAKLATKMHLGHMVGVFFISLLFALICNGAISTFFFVCWKITFAGTIFPRIKPEKKVQQENRRRYLFVVSDIN